MFRRVTAPLLALALLVLSTPPVRAQSSTGEIDLNVVDAATNKPIGNVRTFLLGAQTANALTTASGAIKFTDVPVGIYRIRLQARGYNGASTREFDVLPDRLVHVRILLTQRSAASGGTGGSGGATSTAGGVDAASGLKTIAIVSSRSNVSITTSDLNADSAIRRLSDSLTDALDKLAGVSVTTDATDPNSAITISLNNQDESQTALTLDGIPLSAPGSAGNLRGIGTDLFSGSSVSFAPTAGGLAGGVNFTTLQPTQALQVRANGTTGTYDRNNYAFATTGSLDNVGFVLEHTWRGSNSPLTFNVYEDQSGLTYAHGGDSLSVSDLVKLRYTLGDERTSVTASGIDTNRLAYQICAQDVTILPCGSGPNNYNFGHYELGYVTVASLIGNVQTNFSGYINTGTQNVNDLNRYVLQLNPDAPRPDQPGRLPADPRSLGFFHGHPDARRRVQRLAGARQPHLHLRRQHLLGDQFVESHGRLAIRYRFHECRDVVALPVQRRDQGERSADLHAERLVRRYDRRRRVVPGRPQRTVASQSARYLRALVERGKLAAEPWRDQVVLRSRVGTLQLRRANGGRERSRR